jgi:hypothetical protein
MTIDQPVERDDVIKIIRAELKRRSGKTWSVTGGRGTDWGWITVTAPPARRTKYGSLNEEDQRELSDLLCTEVHHQGYTIPASHAYRTEAVDRARGITPATLGTPYWD